MYDGLKSNLNSNLAPITLSEMDAEICNVFAEYVYATNKDEYSRRRQHDRDTIIRQIVTGKLAELGVFEHLNGLGLMPEFPDFNIYGKEKKSFDADTSFIYYGATVKCHVKSQDVRRGELYSLSWLFQRWQDPLVFEAANKKNDLLVFVRICGLIVDILGYAWAPEVASCYSEPRLEKLRGNKVALYFDNLRAAGIL